MSASNAAAHSPSADPDASTAATLLVVDDEAAARRAMVRALGRRYRVRECADGHAALAVLEADTGIDLVLLDLRMPGLDGRTTLERALTLPSPPPIVIVTADATLDTALDAVRAGAADFLPKPYDIAQLRWIVERTLDRSRLRRENRQLRDEVRRLRGAGALIGESAAMLRVLDELARVAPSGASVLITGETGTGKELIARRLHALGPRPSGPFVALNCAAVPESLLESELFGHRRGAFTGADRDRVGRFAEADGGTLFLDEIGDMPAAAQAKLLRVLQDGRVEPLGGGAPRAVTVRVLAATHRDLRAAVQQGAFREDLYYRLRVVEIALPPLRARDDDVLLLARAFLQAAGCPSSIALDDDAIAALRAHPWPGNVRELRNAMERAAIFRQGGRVRRGDLPAELRAAASADGDAMPADRADGAATVDADAAARLPFAEAKQLQLDRFETRYFEALMRDCAGNVSAAARQAGVRRPNLQRKLRQLGIDPARYRVVD
ncbi:MAG: sigma-54 dependent transcriptional regulator [Acidobacteriota bacterium]